MASSVIFFDDTQTSMGAARTEMEMPGTSFGTHDSRNLNNGQVLDEFLLSRMNDSTSYFFSWFCKHFRIRLNTAPSSCPICLETVKNSIELRCGHTFCRTCLSASAASNFTTCALCRREQILNPDELRKRFDERRMANLARRLHGIPGSDVIPFRASEVVSPSMPQQTRSRAESYDTATSFIRYTNASRSVVLLPLTDEEKDRESENSFSTKSYLNDSDTLHSMNTMPILGKDFDDDVGGLSLSQITERYMQIRLIGLSTDPQSLTCDVGDRSISELQSKWISSYENNTCGSLVLGNLSNRWLILLSTASNRCSNLIQNKHSIGDLSTHQLAKRWQNISAKSNVGEMGILDLKNQWKTLNKDLLPQLKSYDSDVGDKTSFDLKNQWSCLLLQNPQMPLYPDIGKINVADLKNWQNNLRHNIQLHPEYSNTGSINITDLKNRWNHSLYGTQSKSNIGDLNITDLKNRWKSLICGIQSELEYSDVGDMTIEDMKDRWNDMMHGIQSKWEYSCIGDMNIAHLTKVWNNLMDDINSKPEYSNIGDSDVLFLKSRWSRSILEIRSTHEYSDIGDKNIIDLKNHWEKVIMESGSN